MAKMFIYDAAGDAERACYRLAPRQTRCAPDGFTPLRRVTRVRVAACA